VERVPRAVRDEMPDDRIADKREMKDYLESFFERIATPEAIKKTFVNGCPANRSRV